jgi:hypothetical protein
MSYYGSGQPYHRPAHAADPAAQGWQWQGANHQARVEFWQKGEAAPRIQRPTSPDRRESVCVRV